MSSHNDRLRHSIYGCPLLHVPSLLHPDQHRLRHRLPHSPHRLHPDYGRILALGSRLHRERSRSRQVARGTLFSFDPLFAPLNFILLLAMNYLILMIRVDNREPEPLLSFALRRVGGSCSLSCSPPSICRSPFLSVTSAPESRVRVTASKRRIKLDWLPVRACIPDGDGLCAWKPYPDF